jgi:hypothetical protein
MKPYGEMLEVAGETPSTIETGDPDVFLPWSTATPGLADQYGLVEFDPSDLDEWDDTAPYGIGESVAHEGHNWTCLEQSYDPYDPAATYSPDDNVTFGPYDWICLVETTGNTPELNSPYWAVVTVGEEPDEESEFWHDDGARGDRLVVRPDGSGVYRVNGNILFTGTADSIFTWQLHKNGIPVENIVASMTAADDVEHVAILDGFIRLFSGDSIDLRVAGNVGSETVTILKASIMAVRINP